jgi:GST-like protein
MRKCRTLASKAEISSRRSQRDGIRLAHVVCHRSPGLVLELRPDFVAFKIGDDGANALCVASHERPYSSTAISNNGASVIDVYSLRSPNVVKIFIALEELDIPYNIVLVDVWKGEQFSPGFTKLNPNQRIPVIVDHDGPAGKPYTVFESGAILLYLAEKSQRLMPKDRIARYDMMQWLMLQLTAVGPMLGQYMHFRNYLATPIEYAITRYRTEALRLFDVFEHRLSERPFISGDEYTIADISTFPWLRYHEALGVPMDPRPHIARWLAELSKRPAVQRALAKLDTIKTTMASATDDDKDRLFGRGRYARA